METRDVKRRVCQQLQDALGLTSLVPHDLVTLVSGMWALKARKLSPSEKNLSVLRTHLEAYLKKASSSDEAASQDDAQRLLAVSGIEKLEKR